ncbi:HAD hydrolase-like protein [bacterium]|nr:HAD hydrolase-like protein [bacterium]
MIKRVNILFDLDGTLIDPREGIIGSLKYMLHELKLSSPPDSELEQYIGPPLQENVISLLGQNDPAKVAKGIELYREHFALKGIFQSTIYPGINTTLKTLHQNSAKLFVATSKPLTYTNRIMDHFDLQRFFSGIYGAELDGTRAKKGELIGYILRNESLRSEETLMVGDRSHDIIGALENHLIPIGALWGYGSSAELTLAGAEVLCESPVDLIQVFQRFPCAI